MNDGCLSANKQFFSYIMQQSAGRHVVSFGHVIPILSRSVFALTPECCVPNGEATNTYFGVFGLTRTGFEPSIYHTIFVSECCWI